MLGKAAGLDELANRKLEMKRANNVRPFCRVTESMVDNIDYDNYHNFMIIKSKVRRPDRLSKRTVAHSLEASGKFLTGL